MKRHISIFAFLLCAFAAFDATAASQNQYLRLYTQFDESEPGYLKAELYPTAKRTFTAESRNGWEIAEWWAGTGSPMVKKTQLQTGGETCEWDPTRLSNWDALCEVFKPITYDLAFNAGGGSGSMQTMSGVCYTNVFDLPQCDYTRTGWRFTGWRNSLNGATFNDKALVSGEILGISNANRQTTLTAQWEENGYSISTEGVNCTVSANPSSSSMYSGDVAISWTPNSQPGRTYALSAVTVYGGTDSSGTELANFTSGTSGTFNMSKAGKGYYGAVFIRAVYTESVNAYSVALSSGGNGRVEKEPDQSTYPYGNLVTVRALANDGYAFEKWSDGSTASERLLTVTDNVNLKATFTNRVYTLTFDPNGGTLDGEANWQVKYGDYIGELPKAKQHLKTLLGWFTAESGGEQVTPVSRYVWATDVTLHAQWEDAPSIIITVEAEPEEGGRVSGGGSFERGDRTTLVATPNEYYGFKAWSDGGAISHDVTVEGNARYVAVFTGNVYKVSFNLNEVPGTAPQAIWVTYGSPFGVLPEPLLDDSDIAFDYWMDANENKIAPDTIVRLHDKFNTLYAHTSSKPRYFVSFAGGLDATGEMDAQKIYRDEETALTSNAFVRTGYTFLGWAETNDLAKVKYTDGTNVLNIAAADATNELHAVWQPIAYTVAFDGNGATEIAMEPVDEIYGEEWKLPPNTYDRGELWSFGGWSNEVDGIVFADGATVSNLCTTAGGTNTLHAVWRSNLTDLSRAMHCDNLIWISDPGLKSATPNPWIAHVDVSAGYNLSGSDAQADSKKISGLRFATDYLTATGMVSGTLSFYWKASSDSAKLNLYRENESLTSFSVTGAWNYAEWTVILPAGKTYQLMKLRLENTKESDEDPADRVNIDQMTWTPKGSEPTDANKVTISSATVSDGKFTLSFKSDAKFDYNLLTNANLLIDSWGKMGKTKEGTGEIITFEPMIIDDQPQLFYKVETIQKE